MRPTSEPTPPDRPLRLPEDARRRAHRVFALAGGIALLSLADLFLTLTHLRTSGMAEANPVAAYIIRGTGSALALSLYKVATIAICIGVLLRLRRMVAGEVAGWCCLAILGYMCVQWHLYAAAVESVGPVMLVTEWSDADWLHLD